MCKSLEYKILLSVLALCVFSTVGTALAANTGISSNVESIVGGWCYVGSNGYSGNKVDIDTSISAMGIVGGFDKDKTNGAAENIVNINGEETDKTVIEGKVLGGYSESGNVSQNTINVTNGEITFSAYGGYTNSGMANINQVSVSDSNIKDSVYGGYSNNSGNISGNSVIINNSTVKSVYGGWSYIGKVENNNVTISGNVVVNDTVTGGHSTKGSVIKNEVNISGGIVNGRVSGGYGSNSIDSTVNGNIVNISGGTINGIVHGGSGDKNNPFDNEVNISGGIVNSAIYGGYGYTGANDNRVNISGSANIANADLYGSNKTSSTGNTLKIDNWSGSTKSVQNFNTINFENIEWKNGTTVLDIAANQTSGALAKTDINIKNIAFQGGVQLGTGESMTFISGDDLKISKDKVSADGTFTAGVTVAGTGEAQVADDGNSVSYTVTSVKMLDQIELVAENRAVAAAFVNQGTDLINDSLDVLSRDGKYGIKTFAAVHGNRSKYDVNSDLKINGWSSIVGVGSEKNIGNGDFSWGVFYENGSGNYRTYNEFNNEFFRGDGSLVYNGGGIAARFEQDNGVYTEGSLRAGMLKSEMTNALKDGAGNSYGYKSESSYYGAHIGVGKIISLNEATDLDVYGKFFHTYTDGDSFTVANDKFEFDSITSDRLRIGARLTTNKENKFSTYYGLAYEYEFNGDADMRAQNMSAPEQSLKGSSCMAEIGMNYKPSSESPWSFDLSMRGYAGQRDGFSGNVQATYTF